MYISAWIIRHHFFTFFSETHIIASYLYNSHYESHNFHLSSLYQRPSSISVHNKTINVDYLGDGKSSKITIPAIRTCHSLQRKATYQLHHSHTLIFCTTTHLGLFRYTRHHKYRVTGIGIKGDIKYIQYDGIEMIAASLYQF